MIKATVDEEGRQFEKKAKGGERKNGLKKCWEIMEEAFIHD